MQKSGKILVVDDEEVVLLSVRKVFKHSNYEIDTVQSPQLGLAMMESRKYDVIITDLMMPGMNGLEFLQHVQKMDKSVRVIMITGYATMRTALQSMRSGAFDFLAKPFTKAELSNVMHRAMQRGAMTDVPPSAETAGIGEGAGALEPGMVYTLRDHSWVRIEPDMSVVIGVEKSFLSTVGNVSGLELPVKGENVSQGAGCAKLLTDDGRAYTLWCPLSGRVLKTNSEVTEDPSLLSSSNKSKWIIKIDATAIENEIEDLLRGTE